MDGQLKQVVFEKDIRISLLHIHMPFFDQRKNGEKGWRFKTKRVEMSSACQKILSLLRSSQEIRQ